MKHHVTLLPGEGIGPEVARAVRRILEAAGVQIEWEEIDARAADTPASAKANGGSVLNQTAVDSVRRNGVALKGPMATAIAGGAPSVNVALRKELGMPHTLAGQKGVTREMGKELAAMAAADPSLGSNPKPCSLADLQRVFEKSYDGDLS